MDRTPRPNHPNSFSMLPTHSRLEVSQVPIPAGLTPPPSLSLYPSSDPLNLSILVSGGKETNQDSLSNGE